MDLQCGRRVHHTFTVVEAEQRNEPFLYNSYNPKKSFDVYIDKNPKDTISIKYKTVQDVKDTLLK